MHIESEQNSTISIYFNYLRLKKSRNCTESYLRVSTITEIFSKSAKKSRNCTESYLRVSTLTEIFSKSAKKNPKPKVIVDNHIQIYC